MVTKLTGGKAAPSPTPESTDLIGQMEAAKQKLLDIKNRLGATTEYSRYLAMEDQVKTANTGELADAQITMLESYIDMLKNGHWDANAAAQVDPAEVATAAAKMTTGWNTMHGPTDLLDERLTADGKEKADAATVEAQAIENLGSTYAGTIALENSGSYDSASTLASNALFFVAGEDVTSITGQTVGKDIHMQVVTADGQFKVYVLKNMAVRPEPLYIYAGNKTEPITIDLSRVARVADGNWGQAFGTTNGVSIFGGRGDDTIYGSAGNDIIVGGAGNDRIYGLGGLDEIYGDDYNTDGAAGFQTTDGNDIIDGGAGEDVIRAGGGNQDTVWNAGTDGSVSEQENPGIGVHYNQADAIKAIGGSIETGYQYDSADDGTLVIDHKPNMNGGSFRIDMPAGYNMASAEQDSSDQSLIITMTKAGADGGVPETIRIRVKNFFDPLNRGTLQFVGNADHNMIDFSAVTLGNQKIEFVAAEGDDVILTPKSPLDAIGLSLDDLTKSTVSNADITTAVSQQIFEDKDTDGQQDKYMRWGLHDFGSPFSDAAHPEQALRWANDTDSATSFVDAASGTVNLTLATYSIEEFIANGGKPSELDFNFDIPEGFDDAYVIKQAEIAGSFDSYGAQLGLYQLVFTKNTPDGVERLIVNLTGIPTAATILVGGIPRSTFDGAPVTVTGVKQSMTEYGTDTVFGSASSITKNKSDNAAFITGTYAPSVDTSATYTNKSDAEKRTQLKADLKAEEAKVDSAEKKKDTAADDLKATLEADLKLTGTALTNTLSNLLDDAEINADANWTQAQWVDHLKISGDLPANIDEETLEDIASDLKSYAKFYTEMTAAEKKIEDLQQQIDALDAKFTNQ